MIRTLLAQQLKAQRAYVAWTTVLLAAACGLATYAWSAAATDGDLYARHAGGEHYARGYTAPVEIVPEGSQGPSMDLEATPMSLRQLTDVLDSGNSEGAHAAAVVQLGTATAELTNGTSNNESWSVTSLALTGEDAWAPVIAEGDAPASGEVAMPASFARTHGIGLGDTVAVSTTIYFHPDTPTTNDPYGDDVEIVTERARVTLVGLTFDDATWGSHAAWFEPAFYFSLDDPHVTDGFNPNAADAAAMFLHPEIGTVTWDHATPTMANTFPEAVGPGGGAIAGSLPLLQVWLCIIMVGGVLITATATGRSQAQQRAQWTATARALGATRGTIAVATILEGAVMGLASAGLGIIAGIFAAQVHLNNVYSALAAPPPVALNVSLVEVATITALAVVLGLFVTGLPALLASRISPAAALQDTKGVDEAEFSRRVPVWPVAVGWVAAGATVAWILSHYSQDQLTPFWIAAIIFGILTFSLMVEGSRRLTGWIGQRLLGRRSPAAIRAGLDMLGHPRQAAALMVVQMVTMTGVAGFGAASTVTAIYAANSDPNYLTFAGSTEAGIFLWRNIEVVAVVLVIAAALCATVFAGTQRMSRVDSSTIQALGLDRTSVRAATALRVALPQALGAVVGAAFGLLSGSAIFLVADTWLSVWVQPSQIGVYLLTGGGIVAVMTAANLAIIAMTSAPWLLSKRDSNRSLERDRFVARAKETQPR
ncbi:ABC transporter permease [Demequina globuliformis]|uniref:ABC transporter permease n=1 Tax=Demequina globuliformis TaxID=676202 RepID=UPI000780D158|nr:ABC transporter permease [Demequina globuliformis]